MTEEDVQHFKIIFLGDQYVGKSSILNRFYQDKFEPDYQATIGLDFHSKNVDINGNSVRLLLYDTAGQEKFKSLIPMYIRDANIIIVVYDISNKDSFTHTDHWVNETKDLKREDAIFVLVGNKIDLEDKRAVSFDEGNEIAMKNGMIFMETSAKTGEGVNEIFKKSAEEIEKKMADNYYDLNSETCGIKRGNNEKFNRSNTKGKSNKKEVKLGEENNKEKSGCC